jgi:hypothetical protein
MWAFDSGRDQGLANNVNADIAIEAHAGGCVQMCPLGEGLAVSCQPLARVNWQMSV